jgi:hypothetical protein
MIDFDLNGKSPGQILKYLKTNLVPMEQIPNINATEKTHRKRQAVLEKLIQYQLWLARENPEEEQEGE